VPLVVSVSPGQLAKNSGTPAKDFAPGQEMKQGGTTITGP
jgi:hypothetical protein